MAPSLISYPRDFVRQRWRLTLFLVFVLPSLCLALGTDELLALFVFGGLTLSWISVPTARRVGYRGEIAAVRKISGVLPDGYALFNQVAVPNSWSRTGATEIDAIVVGPTGVTVIEIKSNIGTVIAGGARDQSWPVQKIGRRGTVYYTQMRNPVRQVTGQARALRQYLGTRDISVWVNTLVVAGSRKTHWRAEHIRHVPIVPLQTRQIETALLGTNVRTLDEAVITRAVEAIMRLK
ncbi:nuclease-related domain-containing protein [Salinisphaera sp. T31B1]|uniref:nuclease-related domain-containing protein n=1 Tax=Salinisphaera sp. T31B1 TaxID=727963 RepID=UPI00333E667C